MPLRVVVLVSGSGTNLQALLDAAGPAAYPDGAPYAVVAVGADRPGIEALARAERAGISTFTHRVSDFAHRAAWDAALTESVAGFEPDLVVLAGFLKLVGDTFLASFGGRLVNTHPALSPAFPGMHAPADALAYGVKVTGCTLFVVDAGVDTGPILAQAAVVVQEDDTVETLHERIKTEERRMLVGAVERIAREGFSVEGRTVRFG
ncbi:MAG TPA: phosphoribosylglycinamide formyltransferase [Nocardioides sp.]|uniref:phosphoribosylglycinamide formyltransferase n=1 Tax=Nocardioides sp. TaxID=35761 RepID=UPI002E307788|nr:phosphoribosylglycinamide formyltransferase [Nocardioides sp.]HEX3932519.1 phosphoribosylglycinamide formyltransferase [Nocardioides sp.]